MTAHEIETCEDRQRAIVERREREANAVERAELRRDAERARWCEANRADVGWSPIDKRWVVHAHERRYSGSTRNGAIDGAMRSK